LGTHLTGVRPELSILFVGLFSRCSSVGSSVLFGSLLLHFSWRTSLQVVGAMCIASVVMFRLVIKLSNLDHLLEKVPALAPAQAALGVEASPDDVAGPAPSPGNAHSIQSLADVSTYLKRIFQEPEFLLLIAYAIGLELSLGLQLFVSAFLHSIYRESIAESAIYSGTMNFGEVLSLVLGISVFALGMRRKSVWHLIMAQTFIGMCVSATIVAFNVSFSMFVVLGTVLGFTTTLGGYLVVPLHCIELAKVRSTGDIAARVTIVDGLAVIVGAASRLLVGLARNSDENSGLLMAALFALLGTSIMTATLYLLARNPVESALSHAD